MPQDAFTIYHTAKELNRSISGARVDRINQPEKDTVAISIRVRDKNYCLILCSKAEFTRVELSSSAQKAPLAAPSFCMLLRKHLAHAQIKSVEAVKDERIILIKFYAKDEFGDVYEKYLYCEIMGKYSNITLCENGRILGAVKTTSLDSEYSRKIFAGVEYTLPEKQDKISVSDVETAKKVLQGCDRSDDLPEYLFERFFGLSVQTAKEIVYRYGLSRGLKDFVINDKIDDFYSFFYDFYYNVQIAPCVKTTEKKSDFFITDYLTEPGIITHFDSIGEAIGFCYGQKIAKKEFSAKKRKLEDLLLSYRKKQEKKLQIAEEKLLSCADADLNRLFGELIISNIYRLKGGEKQAEFNDYTKEDYPLVSIKLDEKLSPKENAERYFKRYAKQKKTISAVVPQKKELLSLLAYLDEIEKEINETETVEDFTDIEEELRRLGLIKEEKKSKEKQKSTKYRVYNYKGFDILVGKNNVQNDRLTFSAERYDVWLHTKDFHSSHVIVKTENRPLPDDVLLFAAEICAYYSDARNADKVPVDYTLKKFVKKSGSQIGLVYYTDQKTLFVKPDKH